MTTLRVPHSWHHLASWDLFSYYVQSWTVLEPRSSGLLKEVMLLSVRFRRREVFSMASSGWSIKVHKSLGAWSEVFSYKIKLAKLRFIVWWVFWPSWQASLSGSRESQKLWTMLKVRKLCFKLAIWAMSMITSIQHDPSARAMENHSRQLLQETRKHSSGVRKGKQISNQRKRVLKVREGTMRAR